MTQLESGGRRPNAIALAESCPAFLQLTSYLNVDTVQQIDYDPGKGASAMRSKQKRIGLDWLLQHALLSVRLWPIFSTFQQSGRHLGLTF